MQRMTAFCRLAWRGDKAQTLHYTTWLDCVTMYIAFRCTMAFRKSAIELYKKDVIAPRKDCVQETRAWLTWKARPDVCLMILIAQAQLELSASCPMLYKHRQLLRSASHLARRRINTRLDATIRGRNIANSRAIISFLWLDMYVSANRMHAA